ncbi:MAG: endonuclease/exonuclease/phosphatase family protein [Phycisphaerae bacterium]|nr:endonuclease/exonuclease/phosphatase family protein [Phycisphaerae bacterium]
MKLAALLASCVLSASCLAQAAPAIDKPAKPPAAPAASTPPETQPVDRSTVRFGEKTAKPRTTGQVRIATYNAMNLFDSDPVTRTHSEGDPAPIKPTEEREAIAAGIRAVDADIVAMEEIESLEVLKAFRDKYLAGMGYDHAQLVESEDPRGIDNAVLSRFPIVKTEAYNDRKIGGQHPARDGNRPNPLAGEDIKFRRTPLRVDIAIPTNAFNLKGGEGETVTFLVVHHKSGRGADYWRIAEAKGVVDIIKEIEAANPKALVAVLGDFNGLITDPNGKVYTEAGMFDVFSGRDAADPRNISHESGRRIDLILLNSNLKRQLVDDSAFIYGMPARPAGADWRNTLPPAGYGSDHYPVVIDIDAKRAISATPSPK